MSQHIFTSRVSKSSAWLICGLAALFYSYEYLLRIQQSVMVPQLMAFFHVTAKDIGFLSAMYYYIYTPLQLVVAFLTDYYGSRNILLFALLNCIVGTLLFASSLHMFQADVGRLLVGLGSAFAFVATMRLAAVWLPKQWFGFFVGLTTALAMLGAMLGDVMMSTAVDVFGWRSVAFCFVGIGLVLFVLFFLFIREKPQEEHKPIKIVSAMEIVKGIGRALRDRQLISLGLIGCGLYFSLSVFADMWGIYFLQSYGSVTKSQASMMNACVYMGWMIGAPWHGWMANRVIASRYQLMGYSLLALLSFLLLMYGSLTSVLWLSVCLFVFGFCCSVEVQCFFLARERMPVHLTATAIGVVNGLVMLGGLLVLPWVGVLLDNAWGGLLHDGVRVYDLHAFRQAFILIPVGLLVSFVLSISLT